MGLGGSFIGGRQIFSPGLPIAQPKSQESKEPPIEAVEHQTTVPEARTPEEPFLFRIWDTEIMARANVFNSIQTAFPSLSQSQIFLAIQNMEVMADPKRVDPDTMGKFDLLANEWYMATAAWSSVIKIANHPAYQKIIGMGEKALPLILRHLQQTRANWLWALYAITSEQPAPAGSNYRQAVEAWLEWGRNKGYL